MATTPTGTYSLALDAMRDFLASLSDVQTFLGVGSEAAAKAKIYPIGNLLEAAARPHISLSLLNAGYNIQTGEYGQYQMVIELLDDLDTSQSTTPDAIYLFTNTVGAIVDELIEPTTLSGSPFVTSTNIESVTPNRIDHPDPMIYAAIPLNMGVS